MSNIRPFRPDDIPAVSRLYEKVLAHGAPITQDVLDYYKTVFFEPPCLDEKMPSLVYETEEKEIVGFIGIVPRRMYLGKRLLRVATTNQFMVDPAWRQHLIGIRLLRHFFEGDHDLAIADNAGTEGRAVWEGCGGRTLTLRSLHWTRPLLPCEFARQLLRKRSLFAPVAILMRPVTLLADALATRLPQSHFRQQSPNLTRTEVTAEAMAAHLAQYKFLQTLHPDYDERATTWLLKTMAKEPDRGEFFNVLVHDDEGEVVGWFQYYLRRGGLSEVIQLQGDRDQFKDVIAHLFHHAWQRGAGALRGRLDPEHVQELSDAYCLVRRDGPWTLIQTKDREILDALNNNDAFLSRLDGEWWINFPQNEWDSNGVG